MPLAVIGPVPVDRRNTMTKLSSTRALTIVAWMFIADGIWTAFVIGFSFLNGYGAETGLGLFNIWLGVGLLLRRQWAVSLAPISLFISIATGVVGFVVLAWVNTEPISIVESLGYPFASVLRVGLLVAIGANVAFNFWQYNVLARSTVRALFKATDHALESPELSGVARHRSLWWLTLDPRVLVPATIVILVAVHLESNALESKRLQIGMEECLNDFARGRTALDTAEIDTRVVAPKLDLSFRKPTGLTCRAFRH